MTQHHLAAPIAETGVTRTAIKVCECASGVVVCDVKPFCEFGFLTSSNCSKCFQSGMILEYAFHIFIFKNVTCREILASKIRLIVRDAPAGVASRRQSCVFFTTHHNTPLFMAATDEPRCGVRRVPLLHSSRRSLCNIAALPHLLNGLCTLHKI